MEATNCAVQSTAQTNEASFTCMTMFLIYRVQKLLLCVIYYILCTYTGHIMPVPLTARSRA
jgi:hypothetical protein